MHRPGPLLHRLFLALLVAIGIEFIWMMAVNAFNESFPRRQFYQELDEVPVRTERGILIRYPAQIMVQADGTVLVSKPSYQRRGDFVTLDLQPAELTGQERWLTGAELRDPLSSDFPFRGLSWRGRLIEVAETMPFQQRWYFVHDGRLDGGGYFAGYDDLTRLSLGYLGKNGFSPEIPARADRFPVDGRRMWRRQDVLRTHTDASTHFPSGVMVHKATALVPESVVFLVSGGRLWRIDLAKRAAAALTADEGIVSFDIVPAPRGARDEVGAEAPASRTARLLARTASSVMLFDLDGRRELSLPIPAELREHALRWFVLDDGRAIAEWDQRQGDGPYWLQTQLAWIGREGAITRRQSFETSIPSRQSGGWSFAAMTLSPSLLVLALVEYYWDPDSFNAMFSFLLAQNWDALLVLCVVSALLAWLAHRRQVGYRLPGAGAWALFVFVTGVPGWLAYRWHRHWPVVEPCDECHQVVPRDRDLCGACGHLFGPPPRLGTEVFA